MLQLLNIIKLPGSIISLILIFLSLFVGCRTGVTDKIHPSQKAVIVSGLAETDDVKAAQELGAGRFIKKPLTLEQIGLAVKAEIEKKRD